MTNMRIFRAPMGWWCVDYPKVAYLPSDSVRSGRLTDAARRELTNKGFFDPRPALFGLTVLTATSCNLGCPYCFQNTEVASKAKNLFAPSRIPRILLTETGIEQIELFASKRMRELGYEAASLVIFGGEPLLNPRGCVRLLERLAPLDLADSTMISNCSLLTRRVARELSAAGLQRIQVTFDGARSDHDNTRYDHSGKGTYDTILGNIAQAMHESSMTWQFRVNLSHRNLRGIEDLVDDLSLLPKPGTLSLALVDDYGIGYENELDYVRLADRFITLVDYAVDAGLHVPITGVPSSRCIHCSGFAGTTGSVINADGTLYSCWETAGKDGWQVGDVVNGYFPESEIEERWTSCDASSKSHGTRENARRFHDEVDSHILSRTRLNMTSSTCDVGGKVLS